MIETFIMYELNTLSCMVLLFKYLFLRHPENFSPSFQVQSSPRRLFFHLFLQIVCCCFFFMFKVSSKIRNPNLAHTALFVVNYIFLFGATRLNSGVIRSMGSGKMIVLFFSAAMLLSVCLEMWKKEKKIMFVISIVDIVYSLQHRLHDKQCEREFTWRYRSCKAAGLSHIVSAASLSARADFISPSAAITFARASLLRRKK